MAPSMASQYPPIAPMACNLAIYRNSRYALNNCMRVLRMRAMQVQSMCCIGTTASPSLLISKSPNVLISQPINLPMGPKGAEKPLNWAIGP